MTGRPGDRTHGHDGQAGGDPGDPGGSADLGAFEMSLRQSLIMSDGTWLIFLQRPISLLLLGICLVLLLMSAYSCVMQRKDWRAKLAEAEAADKG